MLRAHMTEGSDNQHFGECPLVLPLEARTTDASVWHSKCELARMVLAELNSATARDLVPYLLSATSQSNRLKPGAIRASRGES